MVGEVEPVDGFVVELASTSEQVVAHGGQRSVGVQDLAERSRPGLNHRRSRKASRLVPLQCRPDVRGISETLAQRVGVFECLAGSLCEVLEHGVGSVPEECDPTVHPPCSRRPVEHLPPTRLSISATLRRTGGAAIWKRASSSSGVPQSSESGRYLSLRNAATWLHSWPPRTGYCTRCMAGPIQITMSVSSVAPVDRFTSSTGTVPR